MTNIVFIGGGNMATSIIGGILREETINPDLIRVSDPNAERLEELQQKFKISTYINNAEAITNASVVILAVKPQVMKEVVEPLKAALTETQPLIISIAAGINLESLMSWTGCKAIVRCMPNTPALVGVGASGLFASSAVTIEQQNLADQLIAATGLTLWVANEQEIDAVIAVSGSGPAYYFLMMEAMIDAGKALGLSEESATRLTLQTAMGAGKMAVESSHSPSKLRQNVTSPGGTTEKALEIFEASHFRDTVKAAMNAATKRAAELSEELGKP